MLITLYTVRIVCLIGILSTVAISKNKTNYAKLGLNLSTKHVSRSVSVLLTDNTNGLASVLKQKQTNVQTKKQTSKKTDRNMDCLLI